MVSKNKAAQKAAQAEKYIGQSSELILQHLASKRQLLAAALLAGRRITVMQSVQEWNLYSLSSAVAHLRHRQQLPIQTELVKFATAAGISRYAEYYIHPEDAVAILNQGGGR